jgi:poly(A) polymerase
MQPAERIAPQPWMTAPETQAVLAAISADGAAARFVGGCVRDAVLSRPVTDIDIATHEPPERVIALLERAHIKAVPTGIKHGTVTAVIDQRHFEITTLRRDIETYGRHAKVEFTDDWTADAARRDFTINALFCDAEGAIFDPFGGLADLRARRVRFVGSPADRIREDVLRLLRFFRFYAHYGVPPPDAPALAACRQLANLLPTLSGERMCGETLKLLKAPDPAGVFELMQSHGVLKHFLPEAVNIARLRALVALEGGMPPDLIAAVDPIRRLAALLSGDPRSARAVASRLRFSNVERDRLVSLAGGPAPTPDLDLHSRRRLLYQLGAERFRNRALLAWAATAVDAESRSGPIAETWLDVLRLPSRWVPPVFPVKGRDAVRLGVAQGPHLGNLIAQLESWWIAGDFQSDRTACLAKLKQLAQEKGQMRPPE